MEESRNLPEGELTEQEEQQKLSEVLQIRRDKLESLKAEGKNPFEITTYSRTAYARQIVDRFDELEGQEVSIAGRMMSRRIMGKASFLDLRDASGRVQSYVRRDEVGDERYADFKKWDIGDIVGIRGEVFRTQKGEISGSRRTRSCSSPNPCCRCPRSGTASRTPSCATASGMSTSS